MHKLKQTRLTLIRTSDKDLPVKTRARDKTAHLRSNLQNRAHA